MTPPPGLRIRGLRGCLDDEALLEGRLQLALEGGTLTGSTEGLRSLIPPDARARLEAITPAGLRVRVRGPVGSAVAEIRLSTTPEGWLAIELLSVQAGPFAVPMSLVAAIVRETLPQQPWLHARSGTAWDVDVAAALAPFGIEVPPLAAARAGDGTLELEFGRRGEALGVGRSAFGGETAAGQSAAPADEISTLPSLVRTPSPTQSVPAQGPTPPPRPTPTPVDLAASLTQVEAQLPRSLAMAEAPAPGQGAVELFFEVANPTGALVSLRFRGRPHFVKVQPASLSLRPGASEKVTVEIQAGAITRENYQSLAVTAGWSLLAETAEGDASTRHGERSIPVEVPLPRRLFACPTASCTGMLLSGETRCARCGVLLQACPTCETPSPRGAPACSGPEHHPLPQPAGWPVVGGNPARSGALLEAVRPPAALAWRYDPSGAGDSGAVEWSAPVIAYGMVFVASSRPAEGAELVALDLETGVALWQLPLPENDPVAPGWGAPCAANGNVYAATGSGYLAAVDAARGKQRWAARLPHPVHAGCLTAGNALFVGTAPEGGSSGHLVALWPENGERVWSALLGGPVETPFAARQGYLYVDCGDEQLTAIRAATGEVAWQQPLGSPAVGWPVADEGGVFCATAKGELAAFDGGTGEVRWRAALPGAAAAPPAVQSGQVCCVCADGSLHRFDPDGQAAGSVSTGVATPAALLLTADGALLQAAEGGLYFTDGASEAVALYGPEPGGRVGGPPAAAGGRVVVASQGAVVALAMG
jgi:outer membrane protein assembly factor BamB